MNKWIEIEEEGMPKKTGLYLVRHKDFFPYDYVSCHFLVEGSGSGEFVLAHRGGLPTNYPSSLPIVATHWIRIPD